MTIVEVFYFTATIVLIVLGVVILFLGWRIYTALISLQDLLVTTRDTLLDIKETPKKIQNNVMNSALGIARFIWGRR